MPPRRLWRTWAAFRALPLIRETIERIRKKYPKLGEPLQSRFGELEAAQARLKASSEKVGSVRAAAITGLCSDFGGKEPPQSGKRLGGGQGIWLLREPVPRPPVAPKQKRSSVAGTVGPGKYPVSSPRSKDPITSSEAPPPQSAIDFLPGTNGPSHRASQQPRF